MPIFVPGKRDRHNRRAGSAKRSAVAVLQLTAMVDMFTVLAVFLLQNYNVTGQVIELNQEVTLPDARTVKELKPANVVTVSDKDIKLNDQTVASFIEVKEQQDWVVTKLKTLLEDSIRIGEEGKRSIGNRLRTAVSQAKEGDAPPEEAEVDEFRKITIQADKAIDFLTVKKVMYTVTEAGIYEINFAVMKKEGESAAN